MDHGFPFSDIHYISPLYLQTVVFERWDSGGKGSRYGKAQMSFGHHRKSQLTVGHLPKREQM